MNASQHDEADRIAAIAHRLSDLEAAHPRHVALAMLLVELQQQPRENEPRLIGWRAAGIPRRTFYAWVAEGKLRASKVGRMLLADRDEVARLVADLRCAPRCTSRARTNGTSDLQRVLDAGLGVAS